jgi:hypothetical protein
MALRDYVLNNLGRKLVSFCLAALIWFNIQSVIKNEPKLLENPLHSLTDKPVGGTEGEFTRIPLVVWRLAHDSRNYRVDARHVKVIVSGERELVKSMTATNVQAVIDLTDLPEPGKGDSKTNAFARPVRVRVPDRISVVKVEPSAVLVEPITLPETAVNATEKTE